MSAPFDAERIVSGNKRGSPGVGVGRERALEKSVEYGRMGVWIEVSATAVSILPHVAVLR